MPAIPKPKTPRDPKYLAFIRSKPCCICDKPAEPHHESGLGDSGGMALKCSDYFAIPLCRFHHDQRDGLGFESFWMWSDIHQRIMNFLIEYAQKQDDKINVRRTIIDFLSEYLQSLP